MKTTCSWWVKSPSATLGQITVGVVNAWEIDLKATKQGQSDDCGSCVFGIRQPTRGSVRMCTKLSEPQPSLRWRVLLVLRSGLSAPLPSVPQARLRRWFSSRQGTRCS